MGIFAKKDTENVRIKFIIEIVGKPKEHVQDAMKLVVEKMKEQSEHWTVHQSTISDAEQQDLLFHVFTTAEVEFKQMQSVFAYCFEYLPSSAEIISPESFNISMQQINGWLNDFIERLHAADMTAKRTRADNEVLQRNSTQLFRNFLKFALENGTRSGAQLARITGIPASDIGKFIAPFVSEGWVVEKDGGYTLA